MFTHPVITETLPNGTKVSADLASKLLEQRVLVLNAPIDSNTAMALSAAIMLLEREDPREPIRLLVNSPGGEVYSALALVSTMRDASCPVHTYCMGLAASAAALVLACGDRRFAHEHSTVLIHQPLTGTGVTQESNVRILAEQTARLRDTLDGILAQATGRSKAEVTQATERDNYLSAAEALEFGLIDEVVPFGARDAEAL